MKNIKFLGVLIVALSVCVYAVPGSAATDQSQQQPDTSQPEKTVRLVIEQSEGINLPFEATIHRFLGYAGLKVVAPESQDFDFTLKIQARGEALDANYSLFGVGSGTYYYTGASLKGTISLEGSGISIPEISFSGKISPPNEIDTRQAPTSPSDAHFGEAFRSSGVVSKIIKMLGEVSVPQLLLNALKDENTDVRRTVVIALGETKDPWAVELLITALNDERVRVCNSAREALERITGLSFGEDYEAWFKWWQEHQK